MLSAWFNPSTVYPNFRYSNVSDCWEPGRGVFITSSSLSFFAAFTVFSLPTNLSCPRVRGLVGYFLPESLGVSFFVTAGFFLALFGFGSTLVGREPAITGGGGEVGELLMLELLGKNRLINRSSMPIIAY